MSNMITYSNANETLYVSIGTETFSISHAVSGGGRGRTGTGAEHSASSHDVFRKTVDKPHVHVGPIPPGLYLCAYEEHHPKIKDHVVRLTPTITSLFSFDSSSGKARFYNRDGLLIHKSGPHGSDGCIVIGDEKLREHLFHAVKEAKNTVLLKVM